MEYIKQTEFSNSKLGTYGNCTQVCFAMLLGLPLESVPHFVKLAEDDPLRYWDLIEDFLASRNLTVSMMHSSKLPMILSDKDYYHLISGPSPRGKGLNHHIIGKNGQPFFDPHPDNTMLAGDPSEWRYDYLVHTLSEARAKIPKNIQEYKLGTWFTATTVDEMSAFYMSRLPAIREAARACGYAIGLHGSTRRDFDLMAMPWVDDHATPEELAHSIAKAACGITRSCDYTWEQKPQGRIATSIPCCWTDHSSNFDPDKMSWGHIDLSVGGKHGV